VVVDDAAVTPRYVTGFTPDRELPIIWRIAKGSLFNKIVVILPVALLLTWLLPQAITPLLMLGGAYLCYEGAEKIWHSLRTKREPGRQGRRAEQRRPRKDDGRRRDPDRFHPVRRDYGHYPGGLASQ
jgi:predicted DNA repair protein MutK